MAFFSTPVPTGMSTECYSRNIDANSTRNPRTARLATPPIPTPASTSHPRLLTGKISAGPSLNISTSSSSHPASSGISHGGVAAPSPVHGWAKNSDANASSGGLAGGLGLDGRGGPGALGLGQPGGLGGRVWGSGPGRGGAGGGGPGGIMSPFGGEFPTAAEAANGACPAAH